MAQPSPYTPGEIATAVPGREGELEAVADDLILMRARRRLAGRVRVVVGPRGVGKTSLLREAQRRAEAGGLATVFVTAGHGELLGVLGEALGRGPLRFAREVLGDRLESLTLTLGAPGAQASARLRSSRAAGAVQALEDLLRAATAAAEEDDRAGLVLLVDELQSGDRESLRALAYAWQHLQAAPEDLPLALVAAGLSHTEDVVTDAASFSERFAYRPIGEIDAAATRTALSAPATELGVRWETAALQEATRRSQGYPYLVQLYGHAVWRAAGRPDPGATLTVAHVAAAEDEVRGELASLYRSRWAKASPSEQRFLAAMARADQPEVRRGFIAEQLAVSTEALGMARRSLVDKGIVEPAGHGRLRFTVPGFREYVLDEAGPA